MQSVEVAGRIGGFVRSTQVPKAVALFCEAHSGKGVEMMSENDLEARKLDHGELTEWTDVNAEGCYRLVTGDDPPTYG